MTHYMHMINSAPGTFDGKQIVVVQDRGRARLVRTMKQIRLEQQKSYEVQYKEHRNYISTYSHIKVSIPKGK